MKIPKPDSPGECTLALHLRAHGIDFEREVCLIPGRKWRVDRRGIYLCLRKSLGLLLVRSRLVNFAVSDFSANAIIINFALWLARGKETELERCGQKGKTLPPDARAKNAGIFSMLRHLIYYAVRVDFALTGAALNRRDS